MMMWLSPGEAFRHVHNEHSITMLVEGEVMLEANGQRVPLTQGVPTPVDAFVVHAVINVGPGTAAVECLHLERGNG